MQTLLQGLYGLPSLRCLPSLPMQWKEGNAIRIWTKISEAPLTAERSVAAGMLNQVCNQAWRCLISCPTVDRNLLPPIMKTLANPLKLAKLMCGNNKHFLIYKEGVTRPVSAYCIEISARIQLWCPPQRKFCLCKRLTPAVSPGSSRAKY